MKVYSLLLVLGVFFSAETFASVDKIKTPFAQGQEISFGQLPNHVQSAFEESLYAQWKVRKIERINQDVNNIIYKMTISNGVEEFSITFDQDGHFMG